jgi:MinD-like ATPase involved in chromosome partitioning or flagellar assembly
MALVNVAVEMVKSGLRVLIVDFDLEAPGLDTFNLPRPPKTTKGMVDFVLEYLENNQSPDVSEFIYNSTIPNTDGQLWVMPAGGLADEYDSRFKSIDWRDLYENRDGYLLFEDLKTQWEQIFQPDYVLIDSRTGHTDVSGICTRQLPDAVVLFFFPNEQNRRGLETVVRQIRREAVTSRKKDIKLHFVMSNVPELDDEEGFLASNVKKLRESLKADTFSATIHHYQSLALLTQSVFTLDRPRTRLAEEYRALTQAIRSDNLADREVVLEFLDDIAPHARARHVLAGELEHRIEDIITKHSDDAEILVRVATLLRRQRRFDEALALLEEAGELGASNAEFFLARAELYSITGNLTAALNDVRDLLNTGDAKYLEVSAAARLLLQRDPSSLNEIAHTLAFERLDVDGQYHVATELLDSREGLDVAADILTKLVDKVTRHSASTELVLSFIGQGKYNAAINAISQDGKRSFEELNIADSFNYAMAQWGLTQSPSPNLFQRVVDLDKQNRAETANGHQCLAIALYALNESDKALSRVGEAWQQIVTKPRPEFSCWSYLRLPADRFLADLKEIQQLIEGKSVEPRFISDNRAQEMEG